MTAALHVAVKPELLAWACDRVGIPTDEMALRVRGLPAWLRGEAQPTLKQLEQLAHATHAPIGYFFLPAPPVERLPIPDFRTLQSRHIDKPSVDLLDVLVACQQRQAWYRDFARATHQEPLPFAGSAEATSDVEFTAAAIRAQLGFDVSARSRLSTWAEALRLFIEQAEQAGVLVMVSGIVGNNIHRALDADEFRGFALTDDLAPLVFINGADTRAAQMFTLAHELAHVWLGQSALSDAGPEAAPSRDVERWCNLVAAEILVPRALLQAEYQSRADRGEETGRLARHFKVSTLVILRSIHDAGGLTRAQFHLAYRQELARLGAVAKGSGGDFYRTQTARLGKRFARALVASTLEGETLYRDAFRLLGIAKLSTFNALGRSLGVE